MAKELLTILIGASPIFELRAAIPTAIGVFGFLPLKAYALSALGNFLPVIPVFLALRYLSDYLMKRFFFFNRFFTWLFQYTRDKHSASFEKHHHSHLRNFWMALALFVFVAIPIPLTGAWSGALAAFVFGIPIRWAVPAIFLGILGAGALTLLATLGIIHLF